MLLDKLKYSDQTANIIYKFDKTLDVSSHSISLIKGDNGVGKTRFIEGILLKELKANNIKTLYFGQDIENQILSFNLIFLVKEFVLGLKKSGRITSYNVCYTKLLRFKNNLANFSSDFLNNLFNSCRMYSSVRY